MTTTKHTTEQAMTKPQRATLKHLASRKRWDILQADAIDGRTLGALQRRGLVYIECRPGYREHLRVTDAGRATL
jgi:hypothetical protein